MDLPLIDLLSVTHQLREAKCGPWSQLLWVEVGVVACQENQGSSSNYQRWKSDRQREFPPLCSLTCKDWAVCFPLMQLPLTECVVAPVRLLYTFPRTPPLLSDRASLRYSPEHHQRTGCIHALWVRLFFVVVTILVVFLLHSSLTSFMGFSRRPCRHY